jgi:hypothetical protein
MVRPRAGVRRRGIGWELGEVEVRDISAPRAVKFMGREEARLREREEPEPEPEGLGAGARAKARVSV